MKELEKKVYSLQVRIVIIGMLFGIILAIPNFIELSLFLQVLHLFLLTLFIAGIVRMQVKINRKVIKIVSTFEREQIKNRLKEVWEEINAL